MPGLKALLFHAVTMIPVERGNALSLSLLALIASLQDLGVDIEPSVSMLVKLFEDTRNLRADT
jgi:hypothetical protein